MDCIAQPRECMSPLRAAPLFIDRAPRPDLQSLAVAAEMLFERKLDDGSGTVGRRHSATRPILRHTHMRHTRCPLYTPGVRPRSPLPLQLRFHSRRRGVGRGMPAGHAGESAATPPAHGVCLRPGRYPVSTPGTDAGPCGIYGPGPAERARVGHASTEPLLLQARPVLQLDVQARPVLLLVVCIERAAVPCRRCFSRSSGRRLLVPRREPLDA